RLSLLVGQRSAAVMARAIAGDFDEALALLDDDAPQGRSGRRFSREEVTGLLAGAGFTVDDVRGVRVFADLVPGSLLDLEPSTAADLATLEQAVSQRGDYLPLATQLHLLATR
ncbi:MAG: SAM-dependent methyltransferase, partial [Nocardioides sp.]|nr:SAM-dependent methyltransferase [Nocardioides sp.]